MIDNTLLANTPLWIVRLELSKTIERADFKPTWRHRLGGLQTTWRLRSLDFVNPVQNVVPCGTMCSTPTTALFRAATACRPLAHARCPGGGVPHLLDLRCANEKFLFGSAQATGSLLDALGAPTL